MVQEGGSDSLRLDIVIETIAKLQAIDEASARLQKLSVHSIQAQNAAGRFTGELEARMTPALQKSGAALADILRTGFSPKFIGSVQGVNAALVSTGKTFQVYTNEALKAGAISQSTASSFTQLAQGMVSTGITGKTTIATLSELSNQLAQIQPRTEAGRVGVKALSNELGLLKIQFVEAGNAAEARLNRPLTGTQKAGQGLLLSFSLAQLAAGRLSQAMFGIGFAVLFTGFKFLNLITITVALSAALGSLILDKLVSSFSKGATVTERVSEQMQEFTERSAEAKGETRLLSEEFAQLAQQGESLVSGLADINRELSFKNVRFAVVNFKTAGIEIEEARQRLIRIAIAGGDVELAFDNMSKGVRKGLNDFRNDLIEVSAAVQGIQNSAQEAIEDFEQQFRDQEVLRIALAPVEETRKQLDKTFDAISAGTRDQTELLNEAIRTQVENQIATRREALQNELDIIRDTQRAQTRIIQDALGEQTRAIGDALDERIEIIRSRLDDQVDAIRDSAIEEINVNKEKIDTLQDQERELERVLTQLRSRRSDIAFEKIRLEAQLAILQREAGVLGVGGAEEQAALRALITGLEAEEQAINSEVEAREEGLSAIESKIETIKDVIQAIEDERDSAIDAAKEEAKEREKLARKTADIEIRQAQRVAENKIIAINDSVRAASRAAQSQANDEIKEARRSADTQIKLNNRTRDIIIKGHRDTRDAAQDTLDVAEDQIRADQRRAMFMRDTILPLAKQLLAVQVAAGLFPSNITEGLSPEVAAQVLRQQLFLVLESLLPGANISELFEGFQFGGTVPGPKGKPRLIVAHGGEEVNRPGITAPGGQLIKLQIIIQQLHMNRPSDLRKLANTVSRIIGGKVDINKRSRRLTGF